MTVRDAYKTAGYRGNKQSQWQIRHAPEVAARIEWLLRDRVERDAIARHRPEKKIADLRLRWLAEMESIAFADVRDLVRWEKRAQLDESGNVVGMVDHVDVRPSHELTAAQAAAVKGVFLKAGSLRVDMAPKLEALEKIGKHLGMYAADAPLAPSQVTVNQVNVGAVDAMEAARRVGFLLQAARESAASAQPATLELTAQEAKP